MRRPLTALANSNRATASVEMALSLPIMLGLLFGAFELGNYFMTEHVVVKAVRDGARFAARRPIDPDYAGCTASNDLIEATRNVTRTGQIGSDGTPRFASWDDPESIDVSATCDNTWSGADKGIYVTSTMGTPLVTVRATVPYVPLFAQMGLADVTLSLNAESEAAVTGI
jgi:Flp pilus assembly protein TadG